MRGMRSAREAAVVLPLLLALAVGEGRAAASARGAHGPTTRHPVRKLKNGRLGLVPALRAAIAQSYPRFHPIGDFSSGDFDGNGLKDVALYFTDRRPDLPLRRSTWLFVAFHQMPSGAFKPYIITRRRDPSTQRDPYYRRPGRFDDYLLEGTLGAGSMFECEGGRHRTRRVVLRHDGIIECHDGRGVWFLQGGRYHEVWPTENVVDD